MELNATYIGPFIDSTRECFTNMLNAKPVKKDMKLTDGLIPLSDISACIGFSGKIRATIVFTSTSNTSQLITQKMFNDPNEQDSDAVLDTIAELLNIIAGGAKARFVDGLDLPLSLSLPTVFKGNSSLSRHPLDSEWLAIDFDSEVGDFRLLVTIEEDEK